MEFVYLFKFRKVFLKVLFDIKFLYVWWKVFLEKRYIICFNVDFNRVVKCLVVV